MNKSSHTKGLLITLVGVLILTPDTLLFRLINTDMWTITFWRGVLMSISLFVFLIFYYKQRIFTVISNIGRMGILIAIFIAISNVCFNISVTHTTIAKTLFLVSSTPAFAAILSLIFLQERLNKGSCIVIISTFTGICIVMSDRFTHSSGSLLGDSAGIMAAIAMASYFTLIRKYKSIDMIPATALGSLIGALVVLPLSSPLSLHGNQISLMLLMGLLLPISFGLISIGPRYIAAAEVSLMMLLEAVLGPLLVWLVIDEQPSVRTLFGGAIVVFSIAIYSIWRLKTNHKSAEVDKL